jgi:antirestriction protein ArdC
MAQTSATQTQQQAAALDRARNGDATTNYPAILSGFLDKGIAQADIQPRTNVLTYDAWQALGRQVRRGEHGVRVLSWVPMTKKSAVTRDNPEGVIGRRPKSATVFHVTQTDAAVTV